MTIYIDCPIPIPPFALLSNNCSYYKNENGKSQDADNGKRTKREGGSFESPQHDYHIIPIYGKSITIRFPKTYSTYCIILGLLTVLFISKSCETFCLVKMAIFRYHKSTERVIPMIWYTLDPDEKQDRKTNFPKTSDDINFSEATLKELNRKQFKTLEVASIP